MKVNNLIANEQAVMHKFAAKCIVRCILGLACFPLKCVRQGP